MTKIEKTYNQIKAEIEKIEDPYEREVVRLALWFIVCCVIAPTAALLLTLILFFMGYV